ncbi:heterokaryon incompatibility protein [Fusarium proliferatum]|nr:heterokaryon incompatibility protein [Fusarium proliferatum]
MQTVSLTEWKKPHQESDSHERRTSTPHVNVDLQERDTDELSDWPPEPRFSWGDYETLSYTWGSPTDPVQTILINEQPYQVRQNLFDALSQFRKEERYSGGVKLWVDAVCINQNDDIERAIQVKQMREIYRTAKRTVVWLGKDLGLPYSQLMDTEDYMKQLSYILVRRAMYPPRSTVDRILYSEEHPLNQRYEAVDAEYQRKKTAEYEMRLLTQLDLTRGFGDYPLPTADYWDGPPSRLILFLQPLVRKDYWKRAWIVQELLLSSIETTVVVGELSIQLSQLQDLKNQLLTSIGTLLISAPVFHSSRLALSEWSNFTRLMVLKSVTSSSDDWRWALQGLLSQSTLASDKFYGVLGLINAKDTSELSIDYSRPANLVGIDATIFWMKKYRHLCQFALQTPTLSPDTPTWAVDLTQNYDSQFNLDVAWGDIKKGPKLQFPFHVDSNRVLHTKGLILGEIDGLGAFPERLLPQVPAGRERKYMDLSAKDPSTTVNPYGDSVGVLKEIRAALDPESSGVLNLPLMAISEDLNIPYRPATLPESIDFRTASYLLMLRHFCEDNADLSLWGTKLGWLFPGLKQKDRERVATSQLKAHKEER